MRVTNSMLISNFIRNMSNNTQRMSRYQNQLGTGRKIDKPSDDPVGVVSSLQARTDLSKIVQYNRNVSDAKAWLKHTETALTEMNDIILRAYELAVQAANDTNTQEDREIISEEVKQLNAQLVELSNANFGGRYIFGGYNTTNKPFDIGNSGQPDESIIYNGYDLKVIDTDAFDKLSDEVIRYEVGQGVKIDVSIPGTKIFKSGEDNLFAVFIDFINDLTSGADSADFDEAIEKLTEHQQHIISIIAEVGGTDKRLDLVATRLEKDELNYTQLKSDIEDIDYAEVITQFTMAESVYRASLAVGARIIQPTLVDFLR